jgi:monoterpene epsilon-lactone hydrolase
MTSNSEKLLPDGTTIITRTIPVPRTLSPAAQAHLATGETWAPEDGSPGQKAQIERALAMYPVQIEAGTLAGVPVKFVRPHNVSLDKQDCVLMNLHGGGFVTDSGSMLESIPIAALTGIPVVTVLYRLAPQHKFPAAVDDAAAVYGELLKTHAPGKMAIYGTSAGGILTAQTAVRLRQTNVALPAALGFFTAMADFTHPGDTAAFFSVPGLVGKPMYDPDQPNGESALLGDHDPCDPAVSPMYADLSGFPPTLCVAGTRDMMLSGTANFHRALLRAGVDADLLVFDALPHAHWYMVEIPEAKEANEAMARYFLRKLGFPTM